jgi:hypothetical protein
VSLQALERTSVVFTELFSTVLDRIGLASEERRVDGDELALLRRDFVEWEDRIRRADREAGAAVDALGGIDVDLGGGFEPRLVVSGMDAVDGTGLYAQLVLDAVIGDYEGHDDSSGKLIRLRSRC